MTASAGIWRAQRLTQERIRHVKTVVTPIVDHHVGSGWHVAVNALCARGFRVMLMVRLGIVLLRQMTLAAERIAFGLELLRVGVVTVTAGHSLGVHPAL